MKDVYAILESKGYEVSDSLKNYYSLIELWRDWWKGYVPAFHAYKISDKSGKLIDAKRKSMKMAKRISEDWASLLLNDKTYIIVDDQTDMNTEAGNTNLVGGESQRFLSGDENEQSGGVLGISKFWKIGNRTIEKSYSLGTAAFVLTLVKPKLVGTKLTAENVKIKAIKEADMIVPLSYDEDEITEIALYSQKKINGKSYLYLQLITLEVDGRYKITNEYYRKTEVNGVIEYEDQPCKPTHEVASYFLTAKPFFIVAPNQENNKLDGIPMGMSVYANALHQLQCCDLAFDNMSNDFLLGKKRICINEDIISSGIAVEGKTNDRATQLVPNTGDAIEKTLFTSMGKRLPQEPALFEEYNPDLRVESNIDGIQAFLNLLSFKCGLGMNRYQFDRQSLATATEVKSSNKELTESVWKQRIGIQDVLTEMTRSILKLGHDICGAKTNPDAKVTIKFDDTMFSDQDAEQLRDLQLVNSGILKKWEFRVKWLGEDEETAKKMAPEEVKEEITFDD
jgi:A118 family predicted phage portal protein